MRPLFRLRRFLNLRQTDIAAATGVPVHRISLAERDLSSLTDIEQRAIENFLYQRMEGLRELYGDVFTAEVSA